MGWRDLFTARAPAAIAKQLGSAGFWKSFRLSVDSGTVTEPYSKNAWVYAAISRKAACIAAAPLRVYTGRMGVADDRQLVSDDHPMARVFANPSPLYASGCAFLEAISVSLDCYGEAPLLALTSSGKAFNSGDIPAELYLLQPGSMVEQVDKKTGLLLGWKYADKIAFTHDQVRMLKLHNPTNYHRGLAPLTSAQAGIDYDAAAAAFNVALMRNGADPGGILTSTRTLTKEQKQELRHAWNDLHQGSEKSARLAVLSSDLSYTPIDVSAKEMQFAEQRDWSRSEVMAVLGVTKFEVGLVGDYNRASALAAKAWMWENTLIPRLISIQEALYAWLFAPLSRGSKQIWCEFDLSNIEALKANTTETVAQATALATLYPLNIVNTRLNLGMPSVPYGDAPPAMLAPLDEAPTAKRIGLIINDKSAQRAARTKSATSAYGRVRLVQERELFKVTRAWYRDAQKQTLDNLADMAGLKSIKPTDEQIQAALGSEASWGKFASSRYGKALPKVWKIGFQTAEREMGFSVVTPESDAWMTTVSEHAGSLVQVGANARERIGSALQASWAENGITDLRAAEKAVRGAFGADAGARAVTIARTEAGIALNNAREIMFDENGVPDMEWSTARDALVRDSHAAMQGEVITRGQTFSNGLHYPQEMGGEAGEVINCRCVGLGRE